MAIPLCKLAGTWQEIAARVPDFEARKLEVVVYDAAETQADAAEPDDPRLAIINAIAENTRQMQIAPDARDYLREGRAGGMFGYAPAE